MECVLWRKRSLPVPGGALSSCSHARLIFIVIEYVKLFIFLLFLEWEDDTLITGLTDIIMAVMFYNCLYNSACA